VKHRAYVTSKHSCYYVNLCRVVLSKK